VGVIALRRVQANLKRYRAAVLKAACEGRLVPTEAELAKTENRKFETGAELLIRILAERRENWEGRGKYKEPVSPDVDGLPLLPPGLGIGDCRAAFVAGSIRKFRQDE
jgi:type I restriction enzyme, S subunit